MVTAVEAVDVPAEVPTVGPPARYLMFATLCVVASAATLRSFGLGADVAGYVLGSIVTISFIGMFRRVDIQRRQSPFYAPRRMLTRYAGALAAIGVIVGALHAWSIATELAK